MLKIVNCVLPYLEEEEEEVVMVEKNIFCIRIGSLIVGREEETANFYSETNNMSIP